MESNVASHCAKFGLSDKHNKDFYSECSHGDHDEKCSHCEDIPKLLMSLLGAVKFVRETFKIPDDDVEINELYYGIDQAQQAIARYKHHLIQAYVQNAHWEEMINEKKLDTVFITQDWAMKFLPTEFRESQANWFGKKGIGWHIIAYKHLEIDPVTGAMFVVTSYHVFVMTNAENQESAVNLALSSRSLEMYSIANPQILFAHITSDNAGTYHSEANILGLWSMRKPSGKRLITIISYIFKAKKCVHLRC